jgi:Cu+-exporting ATPase
MKSKNLQLEGIEEVLEKLEDEGKTAMIMAMDDNIQGVLAVADTVKEHSKKAIGELKRMGIEVWMITGDNQRTAKCH